MPTEAIIKTLGFTPEPDITDARIIMQGTYWVDRKGEALLISEMSAKYVEAVISMLERSAPGMEEALLLHECSTGAGASSDHGDEQFQRRLAMPTGERMAYSPLMTALCIRRRELAPTPAAEPTAPFVELDALAAHRVVCGATSWNEEHKHIEISLCWEVSRAVKASIAENSA